MIRTAAIALALLGGCTSVEAAAKSRFLSSGAPIGDYAVAISSVAERRFAGVIRQRFDFSCGSAALATLLRYHYDYNVGEDKAFRGMWERGDRAAIRSAGFSLLDMKRWLASRGITANGFNVSLEQIEKTRVPGIALIAIKNYRHFVVVKGVRGDEVLLGDPSAGLSVMPRAEFLAAWNGIYFALSGDRERASRNFNRDRQWAAFARSPVRREFSEPVSQQALTLTAPFYRDF